MNRQEESLASFKKLGALAPRVRCWQGCRFLRQKVPFCDGQKVAYKMGYCVHSLSMPEPV